MNTLEIENLEEFLEKRNFEGYFSTIESVAKIMSNYYYSYKITKEISNDSELGEKIREFINNKEK